MTGNYQVQENLVPRRLAGDMTTSFPRVSEAAESNWSAV